MAVLSGQKILVTGASGFIGGNLARRLAGLGASLLAHGHTRKPVGLPESTEVMSGDLTMQEDCRRAVEGRDIVFHCAASTSGAAVIARTPMVHVTPNIIMNARLLEAAWQAGVKKFVWISSSTGYPDIGARPVREDEMMNGDPYEKYFPVGWMKRYTEVLCRTYAEKLSPLQGSAMSIVVLRPTNIYGEYDDFDPRTSHVFAALIRKVVERQDPLEIWGTGADIRDLVHVSDLVDALLAAAQYSARFEVFNIGAGQGYSVLNLLERMLAAEKYTFARVAYKPEQPTMIPVRMVDVSKAADKLGFRPKVGIDDGIQRTLVWYRAFARQKKGDVWP